MSERMTGFATSLGMREFLGRLIGKAFQISAINKRTISKFGAAACGGRVVHFDMRE
jgi:hypothetical protein